MNNEDIAPKIEPAVLPEAEETYSIQRAVQLAREDFAKLDNQSLPQVNLIARTHAPHTLAEGLEALNNEPALLGLEPQPGRILSDVVNAMCAQIISDNLLSQIQANAQKKVEKRIAAEKVHQKSVLTPNPRPKGKR